MREYKDYVSFESAALLSELGYQQDYNESSWIYGPDGSKHYYINPLGSYIYVDNPKEYYERPNINYPCPLLSDAQKWIRENYQLHIQPDYDESQLWGYSLRNCREDNDLWINNDSLFDTYEEALDNGIQEAIRYIIHEDELEVLEDKIEPEKKLLLN